MKPVAFPNYIKSTRLYLKALGIDDAEKIFNLVDSQRDYIGEYLDWVEYVKTLDDEIKYVKTQIEAANNLLSFDWCIYKNDTNEFIGYIGTDPVTIDLYNNNKWIDWNNGIISFAYFLKKEASGNGYMTEILGTLRDIAISLGFKRVEIHSEPENIKSQKVAERCGFVHDDKDFGKMYFMNSKSVK